MSLPIEIGQCGKGAEWTAAGMTGARLRPIKTPRTTPSRSEMAGTLSLPIADSATPTGETFACAIFTAPLLLQSPAQYPLSKPPTARIVSPPPHLPFSGVNHLSSPTQQVFGDGDGARGLRLRRASTAWAAPIVMHLSS